MAYARSQYKLRRKGGIRPKGNPHKRLRSPRSLNHVGQVHARRLLPSEGPMYPSILLPMAKGRPTAGSTFPTTVQSDPHETAHVLGIYLLAGAAAAFFWGAK